MNDYLIALALASMPALGNFAGGVLAEALPVSRRVLSLALHAAAGIVLAVVGVELMPEALGATHPWVIGLAFVAGGGFAVLVDAGLGLVQGRTGGEGGGEGGPWSIYVGVAVDLFSDGVIIGTGSTIAFGLGLLLAIGQVPADIPEGFATIATFRRQGVTRRIRLLLAASFALPILLGVTVGYWGVRGQPDLVKLGLLAFTAGVLLTVAVEEMVTEAHEAQDEDPRAASLFLVGGFALFALLTVYLD